MVFGPNRHNGRNYGGTCNLFYDGDICIKAGSGNCSPMSKGEALQLAIDLLLLIKEIEEENE